MILSTEKMEFKIDEKDDVKITHIGFAYSLYINDEKKKVVFSEKELVEYFPSFQDIKITNWELADREKNNFGKKRYQKKIGEDHNGEKLPFGLQCKCPGRCAH